MTWSRIVAIRRAQAVACFIALAMFCTFMAGGAIANPPITGASIDESTVTQTLHVDVNNKAANDTNDGSAAAPLKTISAAVAKAEGQPTKILIHPGDYRERVIVPHGDSLLILQATKSGKAVLTGSEIYTGWKNVDGVYTHPWRFAWGLGNENGWWGATAYNRRREMVFIDGVRMEQVCDDAGKSVAASSLQPGQFTVADNTTENPGMIWLKPPLNTTMPNVKIEVAERGVGPGYMHNVQPLLEVQGHSNVVLRGLTVQHCANYIKFGAAVMFEGGQPETYDKMPRNVLVEDCVVTENNGIGMENNQYRDVTVRNSRFNSNGERGAGSVQVGVEKGGTPGVEVAPRNFLYQDCQFNSNNWRMFGQWGDGNDSAGYKMFGQNIDSYLFERCQFNNNRAVGWWEDYGGSNVTLRDCISENNTGGGSGGYGMLQEMSRGPLLIDGCVIRSNGNTGFVSSGSPNVTLQNNYIYYNCQDVKFNGQRLYGNEIKINSDTGRDSADFKFGLNGWKLIGNTIASFGNPVGKGSIFMMNGDNFPNGRTTASEFANEIVSNKNTFSKDTTEKDYFPGQNVMYSLTAPNGPPNIDLKTWQQTKNAHGLQDQDSRFVYPIDLSHVKDPTAVPAR